MENALRLPLTSIRFNSPCELSRLRCCGTPTSTNCPFSNACMQKHRFPNGHVPCPWKIRKKISVKVSKQWFLQPSGHRAQGLLILVWLIIDSRERIKSRFVCKILQHQTQTTTTTIAEKRRKYKNIMSLHRPSATTTQSQKLHTRLKYLQGCLHSASLYSFNSFSFSSLVSTQ